MHFVSDNMLVPVDSSVSTNSDQPVDESDVDTLIAMGFTNESDVSDCKLFYVCKVF